MTTVTAATQLDPENPWPGLESFEEDSHPFFFGRAREAEALYRHVIDSPVTVLYGRSGLGKTSLLRAGVFPLLRQNNFLPIYVRFTVKSEGSPLTRQLHQCVRNAICAEVPDAILPGDDESLWEYLHRTDFELWSERNYLLTPVIVLDQFEELFTHGERVPELVRAFRDEFGDLAENRIPADFAARIKGDQAVAGQLNLRARNYKLMVSLREDFLPSLEGWCGLIPSLGHSRVRLLRFDTDAALDAVSKPAGHLMPEPLARRVVSIVAGEALHPDGTSASPNGAAVPEQNGTEIEPALLSLFCRELNEVRKRRGLTQFDAQLVEDARHSTLPNYYAKCVSGMPPNVARFIETELISEKGFRAAYALDDAVPAHLTRAELDRLIRARLVRIEDRYGAQWIELTHDVLTDTVRKHRDRRRADEEKAELAERAAELDRARLAERKRRLESEQTTRRFRWLTAAMALLCVVAVVLAVVALGMRDVAGDRFRDTAAQRALSEPQLMLAHQSPNRPEEPRTIQLALAGRAIPSRYQNNTYELLSVLDQERDLLKIIDLPFRVPRVAFSPDGRKMASAGRTVQLWDAATGQRAGQTLRGDPGFAWSVAFSPNGDLVASGNEDATVRVWDVRTGRPVGEPLRGHEGMVRSVAFGRDGHTLVSGGADGTVRVWDAISGRPVGEPLRGHDGEVMSVACSPDRRTIASAGSDATVRLWDAFAGQPKVPPMHGHEGFVNSVAFSPDGRTVVSGGNDSTVRLWDAATGQFIRRTEISDMPPVWGVAFSPDGMRIAAGGGDRAIRLLDNSLRQVGVLKGHEAVVESVAFSADNRRVVSSSADGTVRVWDAVTWQPVTGEGEDFMVSGFSADGSRIRSGAGNTMQVWDPATGRPIGDALRVGEAGVRLIPLGEGRLVSVEDADGATNLRVRDDRTLRPTSQPLALQPNWRIAWPTSGAKLALQTDPQSVQLIETDDLRPVGNQIAVPNQLADFAFSSDGAALVTGEKDGTVRLWNPGTGDPVGGPMQAAGFGVTAVALSEDGGLLAVGYRDYSLRLWDTRSFQQVGQPMYPDSVVYAVAFSPDGQIVAAGGDDGEVGMWSVADQAPLGASRRGHESGVFQLAFSPDGSKLLSAGYDHAIRLWPTPAISPDAIRDALCAKLTHNISRRQWNEYVSPEIDYVEACPGLPETDYSQ